ncbi:hypothetical protein Vretimale_2952 [Volvox reticuliferus]|nr:hypothetical protein Vretimale_2952 [Volvox reticuliferus]
MVEQEMDVLTPSRLRLDSRVVMAHATLQWLTNAVWAVLIWQKLDGRLHCSWWAVFSPTIINHVLHIPMQLLVLLLANYMVYKQIGPPPPPNATSGLVLQYAILHHVRVRSHKVDWAINALESTAMFVVKLQFCDALQRGKLKENETSTPLRLMFTPIWCCWVLSFVLMCFKDRTERMFGSSRDLFFIFLLLVAFKVDGQSTSSWRVVFLVPWMWFAGLMLVAAMVLLLLLFARVWARPRELLLPIGFLLLLLSSAPQFVSYIALVRRLDGDTSTSVTSIMWPNALSWFLMWLSAWVISAALRQKEAIRDALLARGAVWTAQRPVNELTEDEIAWRAKSRMEGKPKPGRLQRVGENLYRRIASFDPALAEQAAQAAVHAMAVSGGNGVVSRTASTTAPMAGGGAVALEAAAGIELPSLVPSAITGTSASAALSDNASSITGGERGTPSGCPSGPGSRPGASSLGLFRNNKVLPAPPVRTVSGQATAAGGGIAAAGNPRGLESTAAMLPTAAEAPVDPGTLGPGGPVVDAATSPMRSSRNSWLAGTAGEGGLPTVVEGSRDLAMESQRLEEDRDVERGERVSRNQNHSSRPLSGAAQPLQTRGEHQSRGQNPGQSLAGNSFSPSPSEINPQSGSRASPTLPTTATSSTASAGNPLHAASMGHRRDRPTRLPSRLPSSATTPAAASTSAAAAGGTTAVAVSSDVQSTLADKAPCGASAAEAAASGLTVTEAATTPVAPPATATTQQEQQPALAEDAAANACSADTLGGKREQDGEATAPERIPVFASLRNTSSVGDGSSPATSFTRRSPAVLPLAEMAPEGPQEGPFEVIDGIGAAAGTGATGPRIPVGREDVAKDCPAASDDHMPQSASSNSGDPGVSGDGGRDGEAATATAESDADSDETGPDPENACVICFDGTATCVLLECGHGGFCRRCAFLQFVRPPNKCPMCRAPIDQVVEIEPVAAVGQVAKVM